MGSGTLEVRNLCWRSHTWRCACERLSSVKYKCNVAIGAEELDANAPRELTVDGVPCKSFSIHVGSYGDSEIEVELVAPLAVLDFTPHREHPPLPGDTSYDEALARARSEYPVNVAEIRETATYWVFPHFQIGSCGSLVEKATGRLVPFGTYTGIDDWIWGYEQGLLDEPPRNLVVLSVRDADIALRTLSRFIRPAADVRARLEQLPATFEGWAVWQAIKALRDAGDAFSWRCEPRHV